MEKNQLDKDTNQNQKKEGSSTGWKPGTLSSSAAQRTFEDVLAKRRDETLAQAQKDYDTFQKDRTFRYPEWLYGPAKGKLFKVECEDNPNFGETSYLEFDSARTAFVAIDFQIDFCGEGGYVDVMKYPLENTATPLRATRQCLDAVRKTDMTIVHTREGHLPDLSDCPYNKILRSKIIGNGIGIGEQPPGGIGRLLTQGSKSWDLVKEVEALPGELIVDKAGKGVASVSNFFLTMQNLGITHLVITGITTDVCVNTIMTEANDLGFWCLLLKDCTGATDHGNYEAAIKTTKMQGGVFGWVSESRKFIDAVKTAQSGLH